MPIRVTLDLVSSTGRERWLVKGSQPGVGEAAKPNLP